MKQSKLNEMFYSLRMWANQGIDLGLPADLPAVEKEQHCGEELRRRAFSVMPKLGQAGNASSRPWHECLETALFKISTGQKHEYADRIKALSGVTDPNIDRIDSEQIDRIFKGFSKLKTKSKVSGVDSYRGSLCGQHYTAEECLRHLAVIRENILIQDLSRTAYSSPVHRQIAAQSTMSQF